MRDLTDPKIDQYRDKEWEARLLANRWEDFDRKTSGCFRLKLSYRPLAAIASSGGGWDHVSVQLDHIPGLPTWWEMDELKRFFFKPEEVAMQLHVAEKDHISNRHNVLHIWRPIGFPIPLPPKEYV